MASTEDIATTTAFAQANQADFVILSDAGKDVARAYGVLTPAGYAARRTFYIDPTGVVSFIDSQVSALHAGRDIAARLSALGTAGAR